MLGVGNEERGAGAGSVGTRAESGNTGLGLGARGRRCLLMSGFFGRGGAGGKRKMRYRSIGIPLKGISIPVFSGDYAGIYLVETSVSAARCVI